MSRPASLISRPTNRTRQRRSRPNDSRLIRRPGIRGSHGFTLFEVLAALGLSAMVMMMIASALQLHLRMTGSRRHEVENAQLARAILRHITNDLRMAVYVDADTIEAAQVAADDTTGEEAVDDATAAGEQVDPSTMAVPGLYGDLKQIRFDISRTTNKQVWATATTDESVVVAAELTPELWGSLRTVSYYVNGTQTNSASASNTADLSNQQPATYGAAAGGLVRQVVDQPVASWAIETGSETDLGFYSELLAEEVVSITFRYSDGIQWVEYWDSYQQGGLPIAIEVTIVLASAQDDPNETTLTEFGYVESLDSIYTIVVHLPTALPTDETEALF